MVPVRGRRCFWLVVLGSIVAHGNDARNYTRSVAEGRRRQLLDRSEPGHEVVLHEASSDVMHCEEPPAGVPGAVDSRPNAYFVMVGPFTRARKYKKWLFAVVALASALKRHGSTADVVVLCAMKADGSDSTHATAEEEALLSRNGVHWRYVSAPYGNSGFHMGHYKPVSYTHLTLPTICSV